MFTKSLMFHTPSGHCLFMSQPSCTLPQLIFFTFLRAENELHRYLLVQRFKFVRFDGERPANRQLGGCLVGLMVASRLRQPLTHHRLVTKHFMLQGDTSCYKTIPSITSRKHVIFGYNKSQGNGSGIIKLIVYIVTSFRTFT